MEQVGFKRELLGVRRDASIPRFYTLYAFGLLREVARNPAYFSAGSFSDMIRGYLYANPNAPFVRLFGRKLVKIDLFHYVPWNEEEVVSRISDELEWRSPPPASRTWRFDCRIGRLKDYMYMLTMGMTEKEGFYSRMIREGLMSREDALVRLEAESEPDWEAIDDLLSETGMDRSAMEMRIAERWPGPLRDAH
jgi:hypothetical protein